MRVRSSSKLLRLRQPQRSHKMGRMRTWSWQRPSPTRPWPARRKRSFAKYAGLVVCVFVGESQDRRMKTDRRQSFRAISAALSSKVQNRKTYPPRRCLVTAQFRSGCWRILGARVGAGTRPSILQRRIGAVLRSASQDQGVHVHENSPVGKWRQR